MEKSIPPGFHFVPTDVELILHYLNQKKPGEALPCGSHVIERDVYASEPWNVFCNIQGDPWEIVNTYDKSDKKTAEHVIYVITTLKTLSKNRVSRTAGCGTWKGQTTGNKIKNQNNEVIGFKKMLVFATKKKDTEIDENNTHWIMHEYSRSEIVRGGDYVLCKIKRVELKKSNNKRRFEEISGDHGAGFSGPCVGNLGEAQKVVTSQEEENQNHESFDAIDPIIHVPDIPPLPDDLDLDDTNFVLDEDFNAYMNVSDMTAQDHTCCGNLVEAKNLMRSQEQYLNQKSFDALDAGTALPMTQVPGIPPPLADLFDLDRYISALNGSLYDIDDFGIGDWVDPSTYLLVDDQQLPEVNESQPSPSDQPKST